MYRFFFEIMVATDRPIVLASRSPRRIHLLRQIGISFTVQESGVDETVPEGTSPDEIVRMLSLEKAKRVAEGMGSGIVIGADTIVVLNGTVLGKPTSEADAVRMLRLLSGKTHAVYTGLALVDVETGKSRVDLERTEVTFRSLTEREIDLYVKSGSPMDKAGAYGIQDDYGAVFVERINGCFYTVVGFPLSKFYTMFNVFLTELQ